ncbi:hypothetical protein [Roseicyclus marinus]|uniref:Curlin associated repeat-containing protein n=1 Tax=Roseicyclus marinus TaxID=2161673 RepID=A0AA48HJ29_9RHOB|nr:hypothetical protein MACH21_27060 [Roseicyclus marinus]
MFRQITLRRSLCIVIGAALLVSTGVASAQNFSTTNQSGFGNRAETTQAGRNFSAIAQDGADNLADVTQSGRHNISGVMQSGTGHEVSVDQEGDRSINAAAQVSSRLSSINMSAEGDHGGITSEFTLQSD